MPDSAGGDQGQRGDRITPAGRLPAISGEEGARFSELLIGDAIEPPHFFPQGLGFGKGCAVGFTGIQPDEKGPLILGAMLAIIPPRQPCGGGGLDFFRGGRIG